MLEAIDNLKADPTHILEVQSKNPADALRCYPRIPEDGKIEWNQSNKDVLRLVNASSEPFSGAFTHYKGESLTIWRSSLFEDREQYLATPGQVAAIRPDGVIIICGKGKLPLTDVTYNGVRQHPSGLFHTQEVEVAMKRSSMGPYIE